MSIRARIFIVWIVALLSGFGLLAYWLRNDVANYYNESFEEILVDTSHLLAELVALDLQNGNAKLNDFQAAFQQSRMRHFSAQIYASEKNTVDLRIYVTDNKGIVVFDSEGKAVGQDYSKWRDVSRTLNGEYGARTTDTIEINSDGNEYVASIAYVGAPIYKNGSIVGMVSVGKPKVNIEKFVARTKSKLTFAILGAVLFSILLAFLLYLWVSRPLQSLIQYAEKVGRGERAILPPLGSNEIRQVGEAIATMRQALEDKKYVEQYVQALTHEIKSPITAIKTSAELLETELPADKRRKFSENIRRETERLNNFADYLLQLATVERYDALKAVEEVDVANLCRDICVSFQSRLEQQSIELIMDICDGVVIGDPFLLRQAIENLLRNALDFSPPHAVISLISKMENDTWIVEIIDQGCGIPDFAKERIFERFYSLPRPSGKKSTGIGLNFVKEIAELHQGSVTLDNGFPGVKARFVCKRTSSKSHIIST